VDFVPGVRAPRRTHPGEEIVYALQGSLEFPARSRNIGGLLQHAPALMAFCAPTTNSYKRLVPGYEAPVNLAVSQRNRSPSARIPMYSYAPNSKRVEFRCPDPSNAYLALSAMLMASLDGIANKMEPGEPLDKNIYKLTRIWTDVQKG
jgi:glutamine synthetase